MQKRLFGLKNIWRGARRVGISDPARTLIDMLAIPGTGGGIDHVADCLAVYAKAPAYESDLLIRYAAEFGNGAVFKRLGFLAETRLHDAALAAACRARMTQGYTRLDPVLPSSHLHTAWRLWVPERWRKAAT
jgi:predicted transcriptional regulator of viral defense system